MKGYLLDIITTVPVRVQTWSEAHFLHLHRDIIFNLFIFNFLKGFY